MKLRGRTIGHGAASCWANQEVPGPPKGTGTIPGPSRDPWRGKGGADRPYPAGEGPCRDRTDGGSEAHGGNREPGPAPRNPGEKDDPEGEGYLPRAAPEEVRGVKENSSRTGRPGWTITGSPM